MQRGLIHHIGNVRPGEAGRQLRQPSRIARLLFIQDHGAQVLLEDLFPLDERGQVDRDVAVKAARTQQGSVQYVRPEILLI